MKEIGANSSFVYFLDGKEKQVEDRLQMRLTKD